MEKLRELKNELLYRKGDFSCKEGPSCLKSPFDGASLRVRTKEEMERTAGILPHKEEDIESDEITVKVYSSTKEKNIPIAIVQIFCYTRKSIVEDVVVYLIKDRRYTKEEEQDIINHVLQHLTFREETSPEVYKRIVEKYGGGDITKINYPATFEEMSSSETICLTGYKNSTINHAYYDVYEKYILHNELD